MCNTEKRERGSLTKIACVRFSTDEWERIVALAQKTRQTTSEFIRGACSRGFYWIEEMDGFPLDSPPPAQ